MSQKRRRRDRSIRPGELAFIVEDCRESSVASSQFARYEGRFCPYSGKRFLKSRAHGFPRFRLLDGSAIWGFECWWTTRAAAKSALGSVGRTSLYYDAYRPWRLKALGEDSTEG